MQSHRAGEPGRVQLFSGFYDEPEPVRRAELLECLRRNLANPAVGRVCLAAEVPAPPGGDKLLRLRVPRGPTFADFFSIINAHTGPDDVNVLHNSDIYFDEGVGRLPDTDLAGRCFALSRWDVGPNGSVSPAGRADSQDAWVFRGPVRPIGGAGFTPGTPGCDNRLARILRDAGYHLSNPYVAFRAYHLHASGVRRYTGRDAVPGPYLLVPPVEGEPPRRPAEAPAASNGR